MLLDDGSLITTDDNRLEEFDAETFRQTGTLPGTAGGLGIPVTSDDGRMTVMSAGDGVVLLYDLTDRHPARRALPGGLTRLRRRLPAA